MILLGRNFSTGQFLCYLLVGLWNTVFGYACFALFTKLLEEVVPQSYLAGSVLSNMVSITVVLGNLILRSDRAESRAFGVS